MDFTHIKLDVIRDIITIVSEEELQTEKASNEPKVDEVSWKQELALNREKVRELDIKSQVKDALEKRRRLARLDYMHTFQESEILEKKVYPVLMELNSTKYKPTRRSIWEQVLFLLRINKVSIPISDLKKHLKNHKKGA